MPVLVVYTYSAYKVPAYLTRWKTRAYRRTTLEVGSAGGGPPRYKRGEKLLERLAALDYLRRLLTHPNLGLRFASPLLQPGATSFQRLDDGYDACLAAIAGVYWRHRSPTVCLAGNADYGKLLLLAHRWIQGELVGHVPVATPEEAPDADPGALR